MTISGQKWSFWTKIQLNGIICLKSIINGNQRLVLYQIGYDLSNEDGFDHGQPQNLWLTVRLKSNIRKNGNNEYH